MLLQKGEKTFKINKEYYTRNVLVKQILETGEAYAGTIDDFKTYEELEALVALSIWVELLIIEIMMVVESYN